MDLTDFWHDAPESTTLARNCNPICNPNSEDIMITSQVDRRADTYRNSQGEKFDAAVVREGLILQRQINTVSAIEFMKNRGVSSATIQRVLSGVQLRGDDRQALATQPDQL